MESSFDYIENKTRAHFLSEKQPRISYKKSRLTTYRKAENIGKKIGNVLQKHGISSWLPGVSKLKQKEEQISLVRIGQMVFDVCR